MKQPRFQLSTGKAPRFEGTKPFSSGSAAFQDLRAVTRYQEKLKEGMANVVENPGTAQLRSAMQSASGPSSFPIQRKPNRTGLPDNLKSGIENLSGFAMDDVKVHYNSSKPAQLKAHAYAQGSDIHLAPGQEKHLPHEAWHVVQQKQGRVKPTRQLKSKVAINDDVGLEREADVMGERAVQMKRTNRARVVQPVPFAPTIQRRPVREFEEDEDALEPLIGFTTNKSERVYPAKRDGTLQRGERNEVESITLKPKRFDHIKDETDPYGLPAGEYALLHFKDTKLVERYDEKSYDVVDKYVWVEKNKVSRKAEFRDISSIPANPSNRKQGKILPGPNDPPISHSDVYQSRLSDCYLHATLISIVDTDPQKIIDLFEIDNDEVMVKFPGKREYNSMVNRHELARIEVKLSKKLFLTDGGDPLYGGKKDAYLWPAFIQKAWAVYKQSYAGLEMGKPLEIMGSIMGSSPDAVMFDEDESWDVHDAIKEGQDDQKAITLGTKSWTERGWERSSEFPFAKRVDKQPKKGKLGILHVYSVLDMDEDKGAREKREPKSKLTLRDPRQKKGKTFKMPLKKVVKEGKVDHLVIG